MLKSTLLRGVSALACATTISLFASAALAQEATSTSPRATDTVIVTGSYIRGTPENGAVPVSVVSAEALQKIGNPTVVELIKQLGISSGTDGETNQFSSNGLEGLSNVNLRGIGPARTLVLLNGRRMVSAPYGIAESAQTFVDTNLLPTASVGRIEVLKDGAAALYGSDAIAGVVNFITNRRLEGVEVRADYQRFLDTDGEWSASVAYGVQGEKSSWVTSFGYSFRSEVPFGAADFTNVSLFDNPQAGYSTIGNPGRILNIAGGTPGTINLIDPGCAAVGGTPALGACYFRFIPFDNLVEEETKFQIFSEFHYEFSEKLQFNAEILYANTDVPKWKTSPSYPPQRPVVPVPAANPGLQALIAQNPGLLAANPWLASPAGVLFVGRSFGSGGFPGTDGGAQVGNRGYEAYRISSGFKGQFEGGTGWDLHFTFMQDEGFRSTNDTFVDNFNRAVRGLGGPNCTGNTPGANGCLWYNPFSTGIQQGAFSPQPNPGFVASTANTAELANWLVGAAETTATTQIFVTDLVFDGELGWQMGGGNVGWALGAQYRIDTYDLKVGDNSNFLLNPCPIRGQQDCVAKTGLFGFLGPTVPNNVERDVWAVFGELNLPITERFSAQVALRHEDYGGAVGSTTDPKIAVRFEPIDGLTFRGSASTTFRGPSLNQLSGQGTTLAFVAPAGAFKAIDTFGNPNLTPESATTFNIGAVLERGGFRGAIDYWTFDVEDPIIVEPFNPLLANVLAGLQNSPFFNRVTFSGNPPSAATFERIRVNIANGPDFKTSGIDANAQYTFADVFGGADLTVGGDISYTIEYKVDPLVIDGVTIAPSFDAVGKFNRTAGYIRPLPQYKASLFVEYERGNHNLRWVTRYIDSYRDERADLPTAAAGNIFLAAPIQPRGQDIDSFTTHDIYYRWLAPYDLTLNLSIVNILDEDPPYARFETNYDPYTHRPFGRTYKIGLSKKFGA